MHPVSPRLASPEDAAILGQLLHDFNVEFDTPTPDPEVLAVRLRSLVTSDATFAFVHGEPAVAVALVSLRPNVWYDGPVATLDELYVVPEQRNEGIGAGLLVAVESECRRRGVELIEINVDEADVDAQRFYERCGYSGLEPNTGDRAFYYCRELTEVEPPASD